MNKVKDLVYAPKMFRYENEKFEKKFSTVAKVLELPVKHRAYEDIQKFKEVVLSLNLFDRYLISYANPQTLLDKLMPNLEIVDVPPGEIIFHYETPADGGYLIVKGKAKDYVRKSIEQIEQETKMRIENQKGTEDDVETSSIPMETEEMDPLSSPAKSLKSMKSQIFKKVQKIKNAMPMIPSLFGDPSKQNANQIFEDKKYKKFLTKRRPTVRLKGVPELFKEIDFQVNEALYDKFVKKRVQYFTGPILKVKYSETLLAGDAVGVEGMANQFAMRARVVVADTECRLIRFSYKIFNDALELEKKYYALKYSIFSKVFGHFDYETLMLKFMHIWTEHKGRQGEFLYREGDRSEKLYLIGEGFFELTKTAKDHIDSLKKHHAMNALPNDEKYDKLHISNVGPGHFFGEEMFLGCARELNIMSKSLDSEYYVLNLETVKSSYKEYWEFYEYIKNICFMKLDFQVDRIQSLAEQKKVDIVPTITMYQDILHEEKKLTKYGDRCAPKFSLCKGIVFNFENYRTRFDKREAYDRFVITKPGQIKPPIHELIDRFDEYAGLKTATTTMTGAFKSARTSPRQTSNLLTALKTERLNSQASKKEESQMNISYRKLTQRSDSGTDIRVELLENFKRAHIPTQDLNTNDENFKTTEIRFEEGDTHRQSEDVTTEVDGEKFHRRHSSMKDVIPQDFYKDFAEMSQLNTMLPRLEAFPSRSQSISLKTIYRPPKDTAANTHSTLSTAARMMMSNRFSLSTTHAEFEEMMNNNSPSTKKFDSLDYVKKVKQQAFERRSKSVTKGKLKNELSRDLMITRKEINPLYAC